MVKDINPTGNSSPYSMKNVNGVLFFSADDGTNGREFWKSDGTEAGTIMVKDINPMGSSNPYTVTDANGILFFSADDGTNGRELWIYYTIDCSEYPSGDLNTDCKVDFLDFAIMASQWLECNKRPPDLCWE